MVIHSVQLLVALKSWKPRNIYFYIAQPIISQVQKLSQMQNQKISEMIRASLSKNPAYMMQFLLDASVLPQTILLVQNLGDSVLSPIFSFTRTWYYTVHRDRLEIIKGQFQIFNQWFDASAQIQILFNFSNECYKDWSKKHYLFYLGTFPTT